MRLVGDDQKQGVLIFLKKEPAAQKPVSDCYFFCGAEKRDYIEINEKVILPCLFHVMYESFKFYSMQYIYTYYIYIYTYHDDEEEEDDDDDDYDDYDH